MSSALSQWATDAFNLVLQRLDKIVDALERLADAAESRKR